jgi:two-component system, NtrC family, response regulator HydG
VPRTSDSPPSVDRPSGDGDHENDPLELPISGLIESAMLVQFGRATACSPSMRQTLSLLDRLARTDVTITLIGETGTGKDLLAQTVHQSSRRERGSFVVLDCGGLGPGSAERELIGHDDLGASGSTAEYIGALERAHEGTLFINDVGELPLELQTRLLRVLDSRSVRRRGTERDRPVDVRVIAAANRDLEPEVAAGRFRQDLYFRLAAAVVRIPPLRERSEDIPLLVARLLADLGRDDVQLSPATYDWLRTRAWPGNVRELKNLLAYGLACVDRVAIEVDDLRALPPASEASWLDRLPLAGFSLARLEQAAIQQTLAQSGGNKMLAARTLGIAVSTLYEKLKRY